MLVQVKSEINSFWKNNQLEQAKDTRGVFNNIVKFIEVKRNLMEADKDL